MTHHSIKWDPARPHVLVIACSDGRCQEQTDEFLSLQLNIEQYDRLYVPGGPGALCPSGVEYLRADYYRRECNFLLDAHDIEQVVLLFHSGAADGPDEAMCADYRRKLPYRTTAELRAQQEMDARELIQHVSAFHGKVRIHLYRAEVGLDGAVAFTNMRPSNSR
ncbi:MAG: hypothetical protein HZB26_07735 [Candidatus Hydrogenedentes bacterium]|nr:hypothetical protein [Candidatus Hydrogenedentota bacterium]